MDPSAGPPLAAAVTASLPLASAASPSVSTVAVDPFSLAFLPDSPTSLPESSSRTSLPGSSSPTRMDGDGLQENVEDIEKVPKKYVPCLNMEFESEGATYVFYNNYARILGFGTRRSWFYNSKTDGVLLNRRFVYSKQGQELPDKRRLVTEIPQKETKIGCPALMTIAFDRAKSKYVVLNFEEKHNHEFHLPQCVHLLRSHRKVHEAQAINIDIAADSGLSLKASHDLLCAQVGGREWLGFTVEDQKNYLREKRQRSLEHGEPGAILGYFKDQAAKNPYLYYAVQLDCEEMITNIFWADHEMRLDYGLFGDALSFDTTFKTNKECRPFALFIGFNHFRKTAIYGAALLYDETTESFEWLFKTFLHAMSWKMPTTIFTDQDAAMAKAISIVMPNVTHGLCTFHLNQNALKHLGYLYKGDSDFAKGLNKCFYGYEFVEELTEGWNALILEYKLNDNMWMKKTWELREKWAHVHMKWSFNAGMRNTQLNESLNSKIKRCLNSELNVEQFFTRYDNV